MKKRLMIFCSLITLLLAAFSFPISAEEDNEDTSSSVPVRNSIRLDSTFYENYYLLPYIESSGSQYINSGIKGSSDLRVDLTFSDFSSPGYIFGSGTSWNQNALYFGIVNVTPGDITGYRAAFGNSYNQFQYILEDSYQHNVMMDRENVYLDYNLIHTFPESDFDNNLDIYVFDRNISGSRGYGSLKLYDMHIYDYSSEEYVRYYYPAQVKSTGIIGLYDAVGDVFYPSLGSSQFVGPSGSSPAFNIGSGISTFLSAGLGWIGDILLFAVDTPIIIVFMAIGLAGAMFRWGRRLVHF